MHHTDSVQGPSKADRQAAQGFPGFPCAFRWSLSLLQGFSLGSCVARQVSFHFGSCSDCVLCQAGDSTRFQLLDLFACFSCVLLAFASGVHSFCSTDTLRMLGTGVGIGTSKRYRARATRFGCCGPECCFVRESGARSVHCHLTCSVCVSMCGTYRVALSWVLDVYWV